MCHEGAEQRRYARRNETDDACDDCDDHPEFECSGWGAFLLFSALLPPVVCVIF